MMTADQTTGLLVLGGIALVISLIIIVYYVFYVIAGWKIFTKAGEKGWKSLIPFYNLFVQYKLTWKTIMALPVILLMGFYGYTTNQDPGSLLYILGAIAGVIGSVLWIIGLYKLSKSFGKGAGFTVGLILLPPIFYMILGFGKAQYIGNTTK